MIAHRYLFRGKQLNDGKWLIGELSHAVDSTCIFQPKVSVIGNYNHCKVDPATIGQCTGIPDKNKVLAYEGGIVKTKEFGKNVGNSHNFKDFDIFAVTWHNGGKRHGRQWAKVRHWLYG